MSAPKPLNEAERLNNLHQYNILDTLPEETWDNITRMASLICGTPISVISLVAQDRQWFKSIVGLDATETSRDVAFCAYTILDDQILHVEDALKDDRFKDNELVTGDPHIRFYAGTPISSSEGFNLGALCVIDTKPHALSDDQKLALAHLGKQITALLDLHLKNQVLEAALQTKRQFLSMISHEIRTPLNAIMGYSDLMHLTLDEEENSTPLMEELQEYAKLNQDAGRRLLKLIDNVFALMTAQSHSPEFQLEPVPLHHFAQELVKSYQPMLDQKGNEVHIRIPKDLKLVFDANILHVALGNLLSNACKFTQQGEINIETRFTENHLELQLSDNGIGMTECELSQLFTPFYKADTSNTVEGSGLGLALSKEVLAHIGGNIEVQSQPKKGTTFTLSLPKSLGLSEQEKETANFG